MVISHLSESIRYTGRWAKQEEAAVTTAPGASLELAFQGKACMLLFSVSMNALPYPRIYIQVDNGARVEAGVDHYIRVEAAEAGNHVVKVIYKSAMEKQPRWYEPLIGKISFLGYEADAEGVLPEDNRPVIEFIGDSITEGIWVDDGRKPYKFWQENLVFENDSTGTYAYMTAEALNMKPYIMAYGGLGLTKGGNGGVPIAAKAYPCCFDQTPAEPSGAEIVVINFGANDQYVTADVYIEKYEEFLGLVRSIHPTAKIVVLSAFGGFHHTELETFVAEYNQKKDEKIFFIDSTGWIPKEPSHPLRSGHAIVAEKLTAILKEV